MEAVSDPQAAYRTFGPALVRKAERMLRSREDAVDVVHALFVELLPRWQDLGSELDLPYLYRAVTNRCLNTLRDRATRARVLARDPASAAPVGRVPVEAVIDGAGLLAALAGELDRAHLEVLTCRFVDDMTQDEIAAHLGISRKTVGKRLERIRAAVLAVRGAEVAS